MMWQVMQRLSVAPLLYLLGLSSCSVFLFTNGARVKSVQITPANPTIAVGGTQQFVANVSFTDGAILEVGTANVIWASSNPAVASINTSGLATGRSAGTTVITGTFDSVSGSTTLTVTAPGQARVLLAGSAAKLEVIFPQSGQGFLYVANPLDNTLSLYRADMPTGEAQPIVSVSVEPARGPAWIAVHPSGKFLYAANHVSGDISAFSIDPATGRLTTVPGSPFGAEDRPWSISVDPDGQWVTATHFGSSHISRFRIDQSNGALGLERWP